MRYRNSQLLKHKHQQELPSRKLRIVQSALLLAGIVSSQLRMLSYLNSSSWSSPQRCRRKTLRRKSSSMSRPWKPTILRPLKSCDPNLTRNDWKARKSLLIRSMRILRRTSWRGYSSIASRKSARTSWRGDSRTRFTIKKKFQQVDRNSDEAREFEESLLKLAQLAKSRAKLTDFTVRDKCNLLDLFVNNEKTLLKIYEALFPHRAPGQG